jgi:hypothetical protein
VASLAGIAAAFTIGIGLSIRGDRRDPDAALHRRERAEAMRKGQEITQEHREPAAR